MLPGAAWSNAAEARRWLKTERARLNWSLKDVERAFSKVAYASDLFTGPGGGDLFPRATAKRVERFEAGGEIIPDWLYWVPLAAMRSAIEPDDVWEWDRIHIPGHRGVREEAQEAELDARTFELNDDQIGLLKAYAALNQRQAAVIRALAENPAALDAMIEKVVRGSTGNIVPQ